MPQIYKLGKSQKAVYELLKKKGPMSDQEIGNVLYDTISGIGQMGGKSTIEEIRRKWARRLLGELEYKNFAHKDANQKPIKWHAVCKED